MGARSPSSSSSLGVGLAYVILPYASGYLLSFTVPGVLESLITADKYFDFVSTLFLAFGIVMEFPIVLILLSKVGIVTSARLRRTRRYAILAIVVFAGLVTPGGDLVSPFVARPHPVRAVRGLDPRGPARGQVEQPVERRGPGRLAS